MEINIIKIVKISKSRVRITLPKEAQEALKAKEGDHIAFIRESPGIRVVKVKLDLE